jgi:hypothetical protein
MVGFMWFLLTRRGTFHKSTCHHARTQPGMRLDWKEGQSASLLRQVGAKAKECGHCHPFRGIYEPDIRDTWLVAATEASFGMSVGVVPVRVHPPQRCAGSACPVHAPSDHHMVTWRCVWRGDRGIVERICPDHHTGHPDPDDLAHRRSLDPEADAIHGCCGCCRRPM